MPCLETQYYRVFTNRIQQEHHIERPRRAHPLPHVLSKEEVKRLLGQTRNMKHRTMLSLIYACGLRRGELMGLKRSGIEGKRKVFWVRGGKGANDRMLALSDKVLALLRAYCKEYTPGCMGFVIAMEPTYGGQVLTYAIFRRCWGTRAHAQRKSTHRSVRGRWSKFEVRLTTLEYFCITLLSLDKRDVITPTQQNSRRWGENMARIRKLANI